MTRSGKAGIITLTEFDDMMIKIVICTARIEFSYLDGDIIVILKVIIGQHNISISNDEDNTMISK